MKDESIIDPQTFIQTLSPEELYLTAEQYYQSISDPTPQAAQQVVATPQEAVVTVAAA